MNETKKINIKYFAVFREQAGKGFETCETRALTAGQLFSELADRYQFKLDARYVRVSVNAEFSSMDHVLQHHDSVVFIPPVAGG